MTNSILHYRKVGGLHFLRLFRLQFSFCLRRRVARHPDRILSTVYDRRPSLLSLFLPPNR